MTIDFKIKSIEDALKVIKDEIKYENGEYFFISLCGSHLYGTSTERSDIDIRGVFYRTVENQTHLKKQKDVISGKEQEVEFTIFEIEKYLNLLLKSNLNMLEWAYSNKKLFPVKTEFYDDFERLKEMCLTKKIGNHARGWSKQIYKMDWTNPKKCLYGIRPLMSYIYLIDNKKFVSDIRILSKHFNKENLIEQLISANQNYIKTPKILLDRTVKFYYSLVDISNMFEKKSELPRGPSQEAFELADALYRKVRGVPIKHSLEKEE